MHMSSVIRTATEDDIDAMYAISCSVHLTPLYRNLIPTSHYDRFRAIYTPSSRRLAAFYEKYIARMHDPEWYVWVAEQHGVVVGFTVARYSEANILLKGLFVSEHHQGQGIGKNLLDTSCSVARNGQAIILEVIEENVRAIGLYERKGFKRGPVIDQFYGAPTIQMYKHIDY
jgi:ribosomal protein S18 acetylase RimI-like enzyme